MSLLSKADFERMTQSQSQEFPTRFRFVFFFHVGRGKNTSPGDESGEPILPVVGDIPAGLPGFKCLARTRQGPFSPAGETG